jgi:hypothetical protein
MSIDIQEIKQKYPLARLAREEVTNLKATMPDGWYLGYCPFCQGTTAGKGNRPSERKFWIDTRPGRGICSCFRPKCRAQNPGSKPMDVINFYARLHGLSNREAIYELADQLGLLPEEEEYS